MALFDLKNFNGEVFGAYVDTVPNYLALLY